MGLTRPIKSKLKNYLKSRGFYQELLAEKRTLEDSINGKKVVLEYTWFVEPGHFYSPLVHEKEGDFGHLINLWDPKQKVVNLPGIKLDKSKMTAKLQSVAANTPELISYLKNPKKRFDVQNDQFGHMDSSFLFLMLRDLKPKQIMEVGSGWSSALMLDVNELSPKKPAQLTFIEPYPERLYGAMRKGDKKFCKVIENKVQSVPVAEFQKLNTGDLLFIDNSHVSKTGSDVNYLFFEVLPQLKKGVVIHIHDIFYPFEYPAQWVIEEKRNWNEIYTLRALLTNNDTFEIMFWPSYLKAVNQSKLEKLVPPAVDFGGSIWLKKVR